LPTNETSDSTKRVTTGIWVKHLKTGRFGQVADIEPNGYNGDQLLRIKLLDGTEVWSTSHLWGVVTKGGVLDPTPG
jgi:hypothetical protein